MCRTRRKQTDEGRRRHVDDNRRRQVEEAQRRRTEQEQQRRAVPAVPDPDGRFAGVNPLEREPFEHGIAYDQSRTTFPDWPDRMTSNAFK